MGSTSNDGKRNEGIVAGDEDVDRKFNKKVKQGELKGLLSSVIADELKVSSRPPSPASFTLEGRKPAEIFRTDLISAMKLPDQQNLNPENYITISDQWRQEWERGVQVPVYPEGVFQPSFRPVEPVYKRAGNFKLPSKLLTSSSKLKSKAASKCPYNLGRMDVEWLTCLNKTRHNKGLMELEESTFEQAIAYIENKCYDNMAHAIATQEGLSIEYDEDVCCDVCQSPDSEELNEMVFCDSCDICVHQACYGIQNIPPGSWLCHPCRKGIKSPSCALCSHSGSAMKKSKNGKVWAHVSCALWIPEVGFGNVSKMEPITRIENIPASRWNLVCSLCREKVGACIQCTVKSCVTAFHVTCGFKHGLEMRTVLDDSAADGVRHICYCTRHSHKNKSPSKKSKEENNSSSSEDAENLRQKRLKQMEADFHKFVSATEIAKDLCLPKELATRIHKYWTLKRKAQDDIPLLPPTLQQQEKLSGKQGVMNSSSNLQTQLERIVKLRCNLEKLRNLCYMVTKREKMRRELYRAREDVFWKEHEVLTDQSRDLDAEEVTRVLRMCKDNFIVDGSVVTCGKERRTILPSFSSGVASASSPSCAPKDRSSSEQDWDGGSGFETDDQRSGGEATKECHNRKGKSSAGTAKAFLPSRRTRRNSYLVSQASSSTNPVHSDEDCHMEVDCDPQNRKRTRSFGEEQKTRTKHHASREDDVVTSPRAFRTAAARRATAVEHGEAADCARTTLTRRRRRRSPAEVEETRKEEGEGWLPPIDNDASVPRLQIRRPRAVKTTKRLEKIKSENQQDSSQKPRVDKESRKENDPLRPAEPSRARSQSTSLANARVEASSKRKRSHSTDTLMGGMKSRKQARIPGFLRQRLSLTREGGGVRLKSPKSGRARGREECDEGRTEIHVNITTKGARSPKTFNNGREMADLNVCPSCKLQHDKHSNSCLCGKDVSHVEGGEDSWNRRELRFRSFQSPKSRVRCSQAVSPKPHCCSSLMAKFCPATVT